MSARREYRNDSSEDVEFDHAYPHWVRRLSHEYWTPVAAARKAAALLVGDSTHKVLDVGSGAGKFCIVGSLATGVQFYGVEQDRRLVDVARKASQQHGADNAHFIHGDAKDLDWSQFDAFYFFNPFTEYWYRRTARDRRKREDRSRDDIAFCAEMLTSLPIGTRVVTYHGFGTQMPLEYRRRRTVFVGPDRIELWIRE